MVYSIHRLSLPCSESEIEGLGQLRLKRLWKEEGGDGTSLLSSACSFRGGGGDGRHTKYYLLKPTDPTSPCKLPGGRREKGKTGVGKGKEPESRAGGRARAPLFQQCGGVARTPASAAGRDLRHWGERWRWRRQWQLCGKLRTGLLDGGVAEAPPEAAGTWGEAEEYVREGSVDSAGGNRHACGQEAEAEQR